MKIKIISQQTKLLALFTLLLLVYNTGVSVSVKLQEKTKEQSSTSISTSNEKTESKEKEKEKDLCACAIGMPDCCTPELETYSCFCAPKPVCTVCPDSSDFTNMHDSMLKLAMKDAYNQQDLAEKAKLQVELFQKAQDFAKEVGIQEMKAKQYARVLNEATRKAQNARLMMFQAANQVRFLAERTIRAITPIKCNTPNCQSLIPQQALNTINSNMLEVRNRIPDFSSGVNFDYNQLQTQQQNPLSGMYDTMSFNPYPQ